MGKTTESQETPAAGGLFVAVVAGLVASACCAGPLILVLIGVGGAWVSDLTRLDPVRPWLTAVALGLLGYAHYRYWRRRREAACACAAPPTWRQQWWLWAGTLLVAVAIALPYALPYFILPQ